MSDYESKLFDSDFKGKKYQLIEKLDIDRGTQEDEDISETNIVNGFDDSVHQDISTTQYDEIDKYDMLNVWDEKKSRNFKSINKNKSKPKGIKTMMNMKENIPLNRGKVPS